jgi:hypothetical protein
VSDDQRAYEILKTRLAKDPSDPVAPKIANALGLDQDDLRAASIIAQNPADMRVYALNEKLTEKIASSKPPIMEQGVTDEERWNVKNLFQADPKEALRYLHKNGYQTKLDGEQLFVKKPGQVNYKVVEPDNTLVDWRLLGKDAQGKTTWDPSIKMTPENLSNFSIKEGVKDLSDVDLDLVQTAVEGTVGKLGKAASWAASLAIPAAGEAARQGAANVTDNRDGYDAGEVITQGGVGLAGKIFGETAGKVSNATSDFIGWGAKKLGVGPKPNAQEVMKAADVLGVKVQPSQILESNAVRNTQESIIDRSFRPAGMGRRKAVEKANETARETAEYLVADRSKTSAVESGSRAAMQVTEELAEKIKPAEEIYESYEDKFKFITVPWKEYKSKLAEYKGEFKYDKGVQGVISEVEEILPNMRDLAELKKVRSTVGNMLRKAEPGTDERRLLGQIYGDLTDMRSQSLIKRAKGTDFYAQAKQDIEKADKIYRESIESVADVLGRGKKVRGSPKAAMEGYLEKTRENDLTTKIFDLKDPKRLQSIKTAFPKTFEILRKQKVEELAEKSTEQGVINFKRLASNLNNIPDESLVHLFGEKAVSDKALKAQALKVFGDSIPRPSNPSGTAGKVARMAGDGLIGGTLYSAGLIKALPILAVPEIMTMTKGALLDLISNPVTRKGFLLKIAKAAENEGASAAFRNLGRSEIEDYRKRGLTTPDNRGLTIPGR